MRASSSAAPASSAQSSGSARNGPFIGAARSSAGSAIGRAEASSSGSAARISTGACGSAASRWFASLSVAARAAEISARRARPSPGAVSTA